MSIIRTIAIVIVCSATIFGRAQSQPISACKLILQPRAYDGKTVTVSGFLYADRHSTAMGDTGCERVIILRYTTENQAKYIIDAIEAKRVRTESRPLRVVVVGRFRTRVHLARGYVDRIDVKHIVEATFER